MSTHVHMAWSASNNDKSLEKKTRMKEEKHSYVQGRRKKDHNCGTNG